MPYQHLDVRYLIPSIDLLDNLFTIYFGTDQGSLTILAVTPPALSLSRQFNELSSMTCTH
jgi:hypothetical protein